MNFQTSLSIIILFLLISQAQLSAQRLTEPLGNAQFETGYSHYWHYGEFYRSHENQTNDNLWSNGSIYFRLGLYNVITASVEGMIWPVNSTNNYPGESFLNYTIGFGISSASINLSKLEIFFQIHYLENLYLDRSEQKSDKRFKDLLFGIPIRYEIIKAFTIWVAPVYVWKDSEYFESQTYKKSKNAPGISFGLDMLLFKHIYLNINGEYSDYFQPNVVVGFRF